MRIASKLSCTSSSTSTSTSSSDATHSREHVHKSWMCCRKTCQDCRWYDALVQCKKCFLLLLLIPRLCCKFLVYSIQGVKASWYNNTSLETLDYITIKRHFRGDLRGALGWTWAARQAAAPVTQWTQSSDCTPGPNFEALCKNDIKYEHKELRSLSYEVVLFRQHFSWGNLYMQEDCCCSVYSQGHETLFIYQGCLSSLGVCEQTMCCWANQQVNLTKF